MNEQTETLIANSILAFVQGKYQEAFDIAEVSNLFYTFEDFKERKKK